MKLYVDANQEMCASPK